ncbi:MAG: zf-HC2 domain-containing protein [Acidobacteriota bacterium]|jgi:hypothetical protein
MSMRCEDVRPLLAELVYEEVDPGVAEKLREHLGTCLSCRRHQMAFEAVRRDLQEWQPTEQPPSHAMTFIAPARRAGTPIWHSRAFQGLAAAAGFAFVAVLTAAAVNLQVQSGPGGWALSTSFGASGGFEEPEPPLVALEQIPELDTWFDARLDQTLDTQLQNRGVVTLASLPHQQFFTDGQVAELNRRIGGVLDERFTERDDQLGDRLNNEFDNWRYYVDSSMEMQSSQFFYSMVDLVDQLEAKHNDQIFELTTHYAGLYAETDRKLTDTNFRIDNLMSIAAPTRGPEQ